MQPSPFYTPFSSPFLTPPPFLPPSLPNLALGMRTRLSASHLTRSSHGLLTQFPPASQGSLRSPVQKTAAGENKESKGRSRLKWRRQIMPWLQTRREVGTATDAFLPKPPQTAHASISANAFTCARFSAQEGGMQGNTARTWWCKSVPLFCLVVPSSKWRCTKENSSRIWTIYDSKMLIKKKGNCNWSDILYHFPQHVLPVKVKNKTEQIYLWTISSALKIFGLRTFSLKGSWTGW